MGEPLSVTKLCTGTHAHRLPPAVDGTYVRKPTSGLVPYPPPLLESPVVGW